MGISANKTSNCSVDVATEQSAGLELEALSYWISISQSLYTRNGGIRQNTGFTGFVQLSILGLSKGRCYNLLFIVIGSKIVMMRFQSIVYIVNTLSQGHSGHAHIVLSWLVGGRLANSPGLEAWTNTPSTPSLYSKVSHFCIGELADDPIQVLMLLFADSSGCSRTERCGPNPPRTCTDYAARTAVRARTDGHSPFPGSHEGVLLPVQRYLSHLPCEGLQ